MTQTATRPDVDDDVTGPSPDEVADRRLGLFLRVGAVALAVMVAAFGAFYVLDQRTPPAPSIVTQQIGRAEAAVREQPNNVEARLALGTLYREAGRLDESVAQFTEVVTVAPGQQDALLGRGRVLIDKGDLLGATADLNALTSLKREGEFAGSDSRLQAAYYWLAVIALRQQQPEQALDQLSHAVAINPTDSDSIYLTGVAQAQLGRHEEAVATVRRALAFVPTEWCEPYQQLETSYAALGRAELSAYARAMGQYCAGGGAEAKQQLEQLVEGPAGVDAMLGLGLAAQLENADDDAVGWYRKVLERDPRNIAAISSLAGLGVTPSAAPTPTATPTK